MKIRDVQVHPVQAPGRTLVVVLVETDAGITGVGEAGLQRRWRAIAGALEHIRPWLLGQDPRRIEYLWQQIFRGGFYPADRVIGSLLSGVDIALWDIKGQVLGVPIYELLGGRCRDYVECFFQPGYLTAQVEHPGGETGAVTGGPMDTDRIVAAVTRYLDEGFRYYRIAPAAESGIFHASRAAQQTLDHLRIVRQTVGNRLELMVDLHTRLSPPEAIAFCRACAALDPFVIEDPIRSEHLAGYRHVRRHTHVPLAAGEQWVHKWDFRQPIEEELVDFVRVDLCIAGGLTEGKKIAAMAEAHLIKLLLHNPLGPVCTAASVHLDLACDNAGPQEVLRPPQQILPDVFDCEIRLENGQLTVPTSPGLGVRFDRQAAKRHPPEMTEPPHWRRPDGSITNY